MTDEARKHVPTGGLDDVTLEINYGGVFEKGESGLEYKGGLKEKGPVAAAKVLSPRQKVSSTTSKESNEWQDVDDNEDGSSNDQRKRKCNDAIKINDDYLLETEDDVREDELRNVEDIETSDEEWEVAINNLRKFKTHRELEAQRAAAKHNCEVPTPCENDSKYEESDLDFDTPPTANEKDNMVLSRRNKKKMVKINEHTDHRKLKWEVGMTFGAMHKFKPAVIRFALAQGYDMTFIVSDIRGGGLE
ncbi:hypothetical protein Cgig2_018889 [Carnegiea gigantea]|uniref:Uncharacterized protein n=1 Tax=Carnegiea gigantea TaxID=171969 RepID=A0A9Q1K9U3_9CARY|nr:hypothetical protein Cgig2_018889 [Carnegiea gigantea]